MVMFDRIIPALMGFMKIQKEAGGVIGVLRRVEHVGKLEKPLRMPLGVDLHAPDIDAVLRIGDRRLQIGQRRVPVIEEQPLTAVIQGPCPGHEIARYRFSAGLDTGDALQQPLGNAVTRLGATGFEKADVFE